MMRQLLGNKAVCLLFHFTGTATSKQEDKQFPKSLKTDYLLSKNIFCDIKRRLIDLSLDIYSCPRKNAVSHIDRLAAL